MSELFNPPAQIAHLCRFCNKVLPAHLDRRIAGSGRAVGKDSTFEYSCTKCQKSFCIAGSNMLEEVADKEKSIEPRDYESSGHFLVGEIITHEKFKDSGLVVGKDAGAPGRITVQFGKVGIKKLVENVK